MKAGSPAGGPDGDHRPRLTCRPSAPRRSRHELTPDPYPSGIVNRVTWRSVARRPQVTPPVRAAVQRWQRKRRRGVMPPGSASRWRSYLLSTASHRCGDGKPSNGWGQVSRYGGRLENGFLRSRLLALGF